MPSRVRVSAPGKSILMGEHAAVYHRPALVAAVDRRTTAELSAGASGRLLLDLPRVGVREEVRWRDVLAYTRRCRELWEGYRRDPGPETFVRVRGRDPAHLVKIALGEAAAYLGEGRPEGVVLRLDSEIPVGAGFGSSAAAAVAVTEAYLALRGACLELGELHRLTLEAERRQHGLPSGVDNAAVLHGGLVWARKEPDGAVTVSPLAARPAILGEIRVFHSGPPAEPTGTVVAAVRKRRESDPRRYDRVLDQLEEATWDLRRELEAPTPAPALVIIAIRDFEAGLEELGVVPAPIRGIVREVERRGGAAKISGAGALSGSGAGSLLVYHPEGREIDDWDFLAGLEPLDLSLGAEGVRRELVE
jgi:mevalonate kinase